MVVIIFGILFIFTYEYLGFINILLLKIRIETTFMIWNAFYNIRWTSAVDTSLAYWAFIYLPIEEKYHIQLFIESFYWKVFYTIYKNVSSTANHVLINE